MDYRIDPAGSLVITADAADMEALKDILATTEHKDHGFLAEMLEHAGWQANGRLYAVAPEWVAALTDAPILSDDVFFSEDDSQPSVNGRVWWYPDYAVSSFAEKLIETGTVTFMEARETQEPAEAPSSPAIDRSPAQERAG